MNFLNLESISKKLALLTLLATLPALAILLYSGLEERRKSIDTAKRDVLMLTHSMAMAQKEITSSTRQILSTLSLLPVIQLMDQQASSNLFRAVLEQNPNYNNIVLVDVNGDVIASGNPFFVANLADRKHVREARAKKEFVVGEYIVTRVGPSNQVFAFGYPVLDIEGRVKGVLTATLKLDDFSRFYAVSKLPEQSFVAITDHQGIRLCYYPPQGTTNPIGEPIRGKSWARASNAHEPGIFMGTGSDGRRRIFAFEQVRLTPDDNPYLYVWAGIPEAKVLAPANAVLIRNLLLMLFVAVLSLVISWLIGKKTLISPIQNLVALTRKFSNGDLDARSNLAVTSGEIGTLTQAFHAMAEALTASQKTLCDSEARFRLLMDSLDAIVYVADMDTYEVLFINRSVKNKFGDITGKICWQTLQKGQSGPCPFCTNQYLLDGEGKPGGAYIWEMQNSITDQWFHLNDRAIEWLDGRIVRLEVATDITHRKTAEEEREGLIAQLEEALGKIKTLSGFLPICASCKMIRDDKGYWNQIESYIGEHSDAEFSHSICPDCAKKLYPDLVDDDGNLKH